MGERGDEQPNGIGVEKRERRDRCANRSDAGRVLDAAFRCHPRHGAIDMLTVSEPGWLRREVDL